jgi:hypothetical protein
MNQVDQATATLTSEQSQPENAPGVHIQDPVSQPTTGFVSPTSRLSRILALPAIGALLTAGLLSLTFMPIPTAGLAYGPEDGWCSVLSYAHQHSLQFGRDIVHPYGPLGFLIAPLFAPQAAAMRMAVDVTLSFAVAAGVCLLAWRFHFRWRLLVLAVFTFVTSNINYASQDLLISIGLLSWGLLCVLESSTYLTTYTVVLVLLAVFSGLAKISCLFVSGLTLGSVAVDLWMRKKRCQALGTVAGFLLGMLVVWTIAGQALSNFGVFLTRGLAVSAGYEQTMALKPPGAVLVGGLLVAGLSAALMVVRCVGAMEWRDRTVRWRSLFRLTWLVSILFLTWKHGFLRADSHHNAFFLRFTAVAGLLIPVLPSKEQQSRAWSFGLALTGCVASFVTLQTALDPQYLHLEAPFRRAIFNTQALVDPAAYGRQMQHVMSQEKRIMDLPAFRRIIGSASADVFGNYQSYAVLNGLDYRPRPVFQSYTAYTPPLMELNRRFYSSTRAPDYVLFKVGSIDGRFPPLEDALVLRDLLINADLSETEGRFLLLKTRSSQPAKLSLLCEGVVLAGERIDFSGFGQTNIWLQIDVRQTLLGRLRQFAYQPADVRLRIRGEPFGEQEKEFCAPAPMLAAGFVASPLLTDNQQVISFYKGRLPARPASYAVDFDPAILRLWRAEIHFRAFRIENPLGSRSSAPGQTLQASES